jgi:purine-cytosine permease-like protein
VKDPLIRASQGWAVLLLALLFGLFLIVILPRQAAASAEYAAGGGSPDLLFSYAPEKLYSIVADYGPQGRANYIRSRLTFDVAFPLVYGLFFASTITYTFGTVWPECLWP